MMPSFEATPRVQRLRQTAFDAALTHALPLLRPNTRLDDRYCWDDRQLSLFYEGWELCWDAPTTMLRRARATAYMLERLPVELDPDDLFGGRPNVRPLDADEREKFERLRARNLALVQQVLGRAGHMGLDYGKLLAVGVEGLLAEIAEREAALDPEDQPDVTEKGEFYVCCRMQLEALLTLNSRYVAAARERGFGELADVMARVPRHPARSFREALQSIHFYGFLLRDLFSCGRPDQLLLPYYEADVAAGVLTPETALELIDCFNLQYTFYTRKLAAIGYIVGGHAPDGMLVENDLTWLFLQSIAHVRLPYPNTGLAVSRDMSEALLGYALELLAGGLTHPGLFNDEAITEAFVEIGVAPEDAREFVHSTCVELTPNACSGIWATSPYHNLPRLLLAQLAERTDYPDFEALYADYEARVRAAIRSEQKAQDLLQLERRRNGGDSWLASCLVRDCLARGKSVDQGGAVYNHVFPDFIGASNAIDSLACIRACVYGERRLTLAELAGAAEADFAGDEPLRLYLVNKCPHFGNNEPATDELARRFYAAIADECARLKTFRGGVVRPGAFSFMMHQQMGAETGATPDGRHAGEAFNAGSDPVSGRDRSGPTASLLSTTYWSHKPYLGGIAVNFSLGFTDRTPETLEKFRNLVRGYMERGGFELQINTVDPDTLRDAMERPEAHADLLVRIGGFSDYFVRQTPALQRELLARCVHGL